MFGPIGWDRCLVPAAASEFSAQRVHRAGGARGVVSGLVDVVVGDAELSGEMTAVGDGAGLAAAASDEKAASGFVVVAVVVGERSEHQHGITGLPSEHTRGCSCGETSNERDCCVGVSERQVSECTDFGAIHERKVKFVELLDSDQCRFRVPKENFR